MFARLYSIEDLELLQSFKSEYHLSITLFCQFCVVKRWCEDDQTCMGVAAKQAHKVRSGRVLAKAPCCALTTRHCAVNKPGLPPYI